MTSYSQLAESVESYLRDRYERKEYTNFTFKSRHLKGFVDADVRLIGRVMRKLPDDVVTVFRDTDCKTNATVWKTNFGRGD